MVVATDKGLVTENGLVVPPRVVSIRRNSGLDGILDEHKAQDVDEVRQVEVVDGEKFDEILKKYENCFNKYKYEHDLDFIDAGDFVFTPEEINTFLQLTAIYEDHKNYSELTGVFVSRLIQNSYDSGHNDFVLNTKGLPPIDHMGYDLLRKPLGHKCFDMLMKGNNYIRVTVKGDVGHCFGTGSQFSVFMVEGNVCGYYLGWKSDQSLFVIDGDVDRDGGQNIRNSTVVVKGNVGDYFGRESINSKFIIVGDASKDCGFQAHHSTFLINGDAETNLARSSYGCEYMICGEMDGTVGFNSQECTFKTPLKSNLKKVNDCFFNNHTSGTVYFLDCDQNEILVRGPDK